MTPKTKNLIDFWKEKITPKQRLSVEEWGKQYCPAISSNISATADINTTPWFKDPVAACVNPDVKEVCIVTAVGMGKTLTFFELVPSYLICNDPGPTLLVQSTESEAQLWFESRFLPCLKQNSEIVPLLPNNRHKIKKGAIYFPHMSLFIDGANITSLQSKSIRYLLCDETWLWKDGMIGEARKRLHDRHNAKLVQISQGGNTKSDWHQSINQSEIFDYSFTCPCCGKIQPYKWSQIKWDPNARRDNGEWDWSIIEDTTHYVCDSCDHKIEDKPIIRRKMTEGSQYISRNNNHIRGYETYISNSLCNYRLRWSNLVTEWLKALYQKKIGNPAAWIQFRQKRLSEFCSIEEGMLQDTPLITSGYSKSEYTTGNKIISEHLRVLSIDTQKDEFWAIIRAYDAVGNSKLLWEGKLLTFEAIRELQIKYNVSDTCVVIDCAYNTVQVMAEAAKYHWIGVNGRGDENYTWIIKGRNEKRVYNKPIEYKTDNGRGFIVYYSTQSAKDLFAQIRSGRNVNWDNPTDISDQYKKHLSVWYQKPVFDAKSKSQRLVWATASEQEHMADCEVMATIAAVMHGIQFLKEQS